MKMPPFEYACPTTLSEAVALLASRDGEAKALAGGQSLVPMLAFRLAQPALLVDLRKLAELREVKISADGVRLGAMVRWRDILDDARLAAAHPLLKAAVAEVAHYQIRNRGTVGGSIAHADPAAEMPGIAVTCDAEFAVAGTALFYDVDADGKARNAHVGAIGVGDRPQRLAGAEDAINGNAVDIGTCERAGAAASAAVTPQSDIHASAAYRKALLGTLVERA